MDLASGFRPKRREWLAAAALALAMGFPATTYPLGLDQGIYAVNAARMLNGHALYSGAWDMKSPGIFFMYALPEALFGFRLWPILALHLALHCAASLALFRLGCWLLGRGPAWIGLACWLMFSFGWGTPVTNGQPDDWMLPFYLWGFLLLCRAWVALPAQGRRLAFWSGVLLGWTTALRSTMALAAILLPLCWLAMARSAPGFAQALAGEEALDALEARGPAWKRFGALLGLYVAGGAVATMAVLSYFLLTDSWRDLFYSQFVWVRSYALTVADWSPNGLRAAAERAQREWDGFFGEWGLIRWSVPLGAAGLASWKLRGRPIPWRGLALWTLGVVLGGSSLLVQLKFFNYHHWPLLPFFAMAAGLGLWAAADWALFLFERAERASGRSRKAWRAGGWLLLLGALAILYEAPTGVKKYRRRFEQAAEFVARPEVKRLEHYARFKFHHIYEPAEDWIFEEEIRERTPPGQKPKLYIWGFRPAIYFDLGVEGPSRFAYNLPLRASWSPPEWLADLEGEVMADPPDFVLVGRFDNFHWVVNDWRCSDQVMPAWLVEELAANFQPVRGDSHLVLWQRVRPSWEQAPGGST